MISTIREAVRKNNNSGDPAEIVNIKEEVRPTLRKS